MLAKATASVSRTSKESQGDIHGGHATQSNVLTIAKGDLSSLSMYLAQQGVSGEDIEELRDALAEDPRLAKVTRLGARVSRWIGKMVSKAAEASWDVSVATAGTLLATAIGKYYGL